MTELNVLRLVPRIITRSVTYQGTALVDETMWSVTAAVVDLVQRAPLVYAAVHDILYSNYCTQCIWMQPIYAK